MYIGPQDSRLKLSGILLFQYFLEPKMYNMHKTISRRGSAVCTGF